MGCTSPIPMYFNIPVLSWLYLKGRAKCCGAKISIQYPLVELVTGLFFVLAYLKWPFIAGELATFHVSPIEQLRFTHAVLFISTLIVVSVIDIRLMIIPDVISFPMIALTPIVAYFHPELSFDSALLGVVIGGGGLYAVSTLYFYLRGEEGMGLGDVKLLAGIGGWLGYQSLLPTVISGSLIGSFAGIMIMLINRSASLKTAIPFGPFLAIGSVIYLFAGQALYELFIAGSQF